MSETSVGIANGAVLVKGEGMSFLRLKTAVTLRLPTGTVRTLAKGEFSFPESALSLVADILNEGQTLSSEVASALLVQRAHASARMEVLRIIADADIGAPISPWDKLLDPLQAVAVNAMSQSGLLGFCLFDEQGSGKTVMAISAFDTLCGRGEISRAIIVCPKSMLSEWPEQIARFISGKYRAALLEGTPQQKRELILSRPDIVVCSFETVGSQLIPLKTLAAGATTLLIVDESFYAKNPEAIRSENLRALRKVCVKGFVLCGTPAPNSAGDLVNQFDLADGGCTFSGFRPTGIAEQDGPQIQSTIEEKGVFLRRQKKDILEYVPDKDFIIHPVVLEGAQRRIYEQARDELLIELRSLNNATFRKSLLDYFRRRSAMLQICACPSMVDPLFIGDHAKLLALDTLLGDLIGTQGKKVIVWSFFTRCLDEVQRRYPSYRPVRVDGTITSSELRRDAINQFQTDPEVKLFLGNPAAAGAGITLHAAAEAVYLSYSSQAAHHLQSLDRIHRRGQTAAVTTYHFLVCAGTIEESELARLRHKELTQGRLLGDEVEWPGSLDDALAELTGVGA